MLEDCIILLISYHCSLAYFVNFIIPKILMKSNNCSRNRLKITYTGCPKIDGLLDVSEEQNFSGDFGFLSSNSFDILLETPYILLYFLLSSYFSIIFV